MILEGVHAGSQGPIYYSKSELSKTPKMWNMKPITVAHPKRGDTATDLGIYKSQAIGMIIPLFKPAILANLVKFSKLKDFLQQNFAR